MRNLQIGSTVVFACDRLKVITFNEVTGEAVCTPEKVGLTIRNVDVINIPLYVKPFSLDLEFTCRFNAPQATLNKKTKIRGHYHIEGVTFEMRPSRDFKETNEVLFFKMFHGFKEKINGRNADFGQRTRNLPFRFKKKMKGELIYHIPDWFKNNFRDTVLYPEQLRGIVTGIKVFNKVPKLGVENLTQVNAAFAGDCLITYQLLSDEQHLLIHDLKYLKYD